MRERVCVNKPTRPRRRFIIPRMQMHLREPHYTKDRGRATACSNYRYCVLYLFHLRVLAVS